MRGRVGGDFKPRPEQCPVRRHYRPGLPDFSACNIEKHGKAWVRGSSVCVWELTVAIDHTKHKTPLLVRLTDYTRNNTLNFAQRNSF